MKATIDLTENRDFRKPIGLSRLSSFVKSFPWSFHRLYFSEDTIQELFYTGTKEERLKKQNHYLFETGAVCERCGALLETLPWRKAHYGLCYQCDEYLDLDFEGKRLWGNFHAPIKRSVNQEELIELDIADLDEIFSDLDLL